MTKASDIYTLFLKPEHLKPDQVTQVTIESATVEQLHPRPGETKAAIVLSFRGAVRKLIVNQGNANRLATIGGDDIDGWIGLAIGLKRGKHGHRDTIHIVEPPKNGK